MNAKRWCSTSSPPCTARRKCKLNCLEESDSLKEETKPLRYRIATSTPTASSTAATAAAPRPLMFSPVSKCGTSPTRSCWTQNLIIDGNVPRWKSSKLKPASERCSLKPKNSTPSGEGPPLSPSSCESCSNPARDSFRRRGFILSITARNLMVDRPTQLCLVDITMPATSRTNQKIIPGRRTECRQTGYADAKPATCPGNRNKPTQTLRRLFR